MLEIHTRVAVKPDTYALALVEIKLGNRLMKHASGVVVDEHYVHVYYVCAQSDSGCDPSTRARTHTHTHMRERHLLPHSSETYPRPGQGHSSSAALYCVCVCVP
jgi:hypothetical protein